MFVAKNIDEKSFGLFCDDLNKFQHLENFILYIENNQRFYNNFGSKKIRISKRKKSEGKKMEGKVGF